MTTKPETKFWKRIKNKFTKVTLTRIEAVTPLGLPDVLAVFKLRNKRRGQFWIELKVTTGNKVNLSPGQISWHMSHIRTVAVHLLWPPPSDEETSLFILDLVPCDLQKKA